MSDVYITRIAKFLPNNPISNDEMEDYLGKINGQRSKSKAIVLRNNGIKNRYYAFDKSGTPTNTNAQMASLAVRKLFQNNEEELSNTELLCCGTTTPDQLLPSQAIMVHGLLPELGNIEVTSNSGSCCSGMHAFKFGYLAVKSGEVQQAVTTGSERVSQLLRSEVFDEEAKHLAELKENPYIAFEKDFLRWMLSDGAGAFLLNDKKSDTGLSLKVEWIELSSFAYAKEACMYIGAEKLENGELRSYLEMSQEEIMKKSILSIKQDTKVLSENIVELGFTELKDIFTRRNVKAEDIDYLLPHMSSYFFQDKIRQILEKNGIGIPYEKWFTNLRDKGNVGAGSIYIMLEELFNELPLKIGQKILLAVPESARFSYAFALLTVC